MVSVPQVYPFSVRTISSPYEYTNLALQMVASAEGYIAKLADAIGSPPGEIVPNFPSVGDAPPINIVAPPTIGPIVWTAPAIPVSFTGTLEVDQYFPQPFDDNPPALVFPGAPVAFTETLPAAPGVQLQFEYPELSVNLPAPPSLLTISVSSFGGINMPTLTAEVPELNLVAPSIREYTPGTQYTSALLTSVKNALQDRIDNGGTGDGALVDVGITRGRNCGSISTV